MREKFIFSTVHAEFLQSRFLICTTHQCLSDEYGIGTVLLRSLDIMSRLHTRFRMQRMFSGTSSRRRTELWISTVKSFRFRLLTPTILASAAAPSLLPSRHGLPPVPTGKFSGNPAYSDNCMGERIAQIRRTASAPIFLPHRSCIRLPVRNLSAAEDLHRLPDLRQIFILPS